MRGYTAVFERNRNLGVVCESTYIIYDIYRIVYESSSTIFDRLGVVYENSRGLFL